MWSQASVPSFLTGPQEDDIMSDTDSDEEEEEADPTDASWPTVEDSERAFRGVEGEGVVPGKRIEGGNRRVVMLARDRTQMLLGKRRAHARFPRATSITNYLSQVDDAIVFPKHKLGF